MKRHERVKVTIIKEVFLLVFILDWKYNNKRKKAPTQKKLDKVVGYIFPIISDGNTLKHSLKMLYANCPLLNIIR